MSDEVPPVTASAKSAPEIGPVRPKERIEVIDILRGFALFGVLAANMLYFSLPDYLPFAQVWTGTADQAALWLIEFVVRGKFIRLFSFLFGLGFALQMARAESRGVRFFPVYRRRLLVLLLIGLAHALLLLSPGDILHWYVMFGFLLLLFRARSPRTLLIAAFICLLIPIAHDAVDIRLHELRRADPQVAQEVSRQDAERAAEDRAGQERQLRLYSQGTYGEMVADRARWFKEWHSSLRSYSHYLGGAFVMFLLGLYAGRRRIFENLPVHLPFIRRVLWWGLGLGLVGMSAHVLLDPRYIGESADEDLFLALGRPAMCFFYASAIILLVQREAWKKRLAPLAAVGRLALSNYLLQSLVCTTIFYSYGLGLFGKVGPALGLALTVLIFALQILLSVWWLGRFQFGPMEWLWRSLTYGKRQPLRVQRVVAATR
mgnify:CR=1 FL=1